MQSQTNHVMLCREHMTRLSHTQQLSMQSQTERVKQCRKQSKARPHKPKGTSSAVRVEESRETAEERASQATFCSSASAIADVCRWSPASTAATLSGVSLLCSVFSIKAMWLTQGGQTCVEEGWALAVARRRPPRHVDIHG
jgi:hypothetical protein